MGLDLRWPIGIMFATFGVIMCLFGLFSDPQIYADHSLGININLGWGLVLLLFAAVMIGLALRAQKKH